MRNRIVWSLLGPALMAISALAVAATPSGTSGQWSVAATGSKACASCPSGFSLSFVSSNTASGVAQEFSVSNMMDHVSSVKVFNSKALIIGTVGTAGQACTVYDLDKRKVADEFYALDPSASPDSRFVAFVRFHPRHADDAEMNGVVLLYDLSRSVVENRAPANRKTPSPWNAGIPIFPKRNKTEGQTTPYADQPQFIYPKFVWAPSGKSVGFVAEAAPLRQVMEKGHSTTSVVAVTASVPDSLEGAKVSQHRIEMKALLTPKAQAATDYKFHVKNMKLNDEGRLEFEDEQMLPASSVNPVSDHDDQY